MATTTVATSATLDYIKYIIGEYKNKKYGELFYWCLPTNVDIMEFRKYTNEYRFFFDQIVIISRSKRAGDLLSSYMGSISKHIEGTYTLTPEQYMVFIYKMGIIPLVDKAGMYDRYKEFLLSRMTEITGVPDWYYPSKNREYCKYLASILFEFESSADRITASVVSGLAVNEAAMRDRQMMMVQQSKILESVGNYVMNVSNSLYERAVANAEMTHLLEDVLLLIYNKTRDVTSKNAQTVMNEIQRLIPDDITSNVNVGMYEEWNDTLKLRDVLITLYKTLTSIVSESEVDVITATEGSVSVTRSDVDDILGLLYVLKERSVKGTFTIDISELPPPSEGGAITEETIPPPPPPSPPPPPPPKSPRIHLSPSILVAPGKPKTFIPEKGQTTPPGKSFVQEIQDHSYELKKASQNLADKSTIEVKASTMTLVDEIKRYSKEKMRHVMVTDRTGILPYGPMNLMKTQLSTAIQKRRGPIGTSESEEEPQQWPQEEEEKPKPGTYEVTETPSPLIQQQPYLVILKTEEKVPMTEIPKNIVIEPVQKRIENEEVVKKIQQTIIENQIEAMKQRRPLPSIPKAKKPTVQSAILEVSEKVKHGIQKPIEAAKRMVSAVKNTVSMKRQLFEEEALRLSKGLPLTKKKTATVGECNNIDSFVASFLGDDIYVPDIDNEETTSCCSTVGEPFGCSNRLSVRSCCRCTSPAKFACGSCMKIYYCDNPLCLSHYKTHHMPGCRGSIY